MSSSKNSLNNRNYRCPRCEWPMETILSKYVSKEGNFEFLHCFNCGQDFYKELVKLIKSDRGDIEEIILKRVEVELDYIVNPGKKSLTLSGKKSYLKWN